MADFYHRILALSPRKQQLLSSALLNEQKTCKPGKTDMSGNERLVAYIVPKPEQSLTIKALRHFLYEELPEHMIPSVFTIVDALPLTSSGKVDRHALRSLLTGEKKLTTPLAAPRTSVEKVLADIWTTLLQVEQIGIHDNFFELGGHSLLVIQLISRIQKVFQVELSVEKIFEFPNIAQLAQFIVTRRREERSTTTQAVSVPDPDKEVDLDPAIRPEKGSNPPHFMTDYKHIFLTGATGFLGAFLLHELLQQTQADIHCLVRCSNGREGRKRIRRTLELYSLWNEQFDSRIIVVQGDLSRPRLGLSVEQFNKMARQIDVIYHNGAMVNFVYPYSALKGPNVLGTQEILRLATHIHMKPVHYISTISVFESASYAEKESIFEHDPLDSIEGIHDGYSQSKWVAEKLVTIARSRGIPVCIYRPGTISGHSQSGVWNTEDFTCRMFKGCIQLGSVPQQDIMMDMTPVDYVSKAIVYLSTQEESLGKAFHLVNPQPAHWNDIVDWICSFNYPLRKIPYEQWQAELIRENKIRENALDPFLPLFLGQNFQEEEVEPQRFNCQNTITSLKNTSIKCPPADGALLHTYFSYFIRTRFLELPQQLKD